MIVAPVPPPPPRRSTAHDPMYDQIDNQDGSYEMPVPGPTNVTLDDDRYVSTASSRNQDSEGRSYEVPVSQSGRTSHHAAPAGSSSRDQIRGPVVNVTLDDDNYVSTTSSNGPEYELPTDVGDSASTYSVLIRTRPQGTDQQSASNFGSYV